MGYFNPVYKYGVEKFCKKAAEVGIDGVIIPDLPMNEYLEKYHRIFTENKLANIFLVTPQTLPERIKLIDDITDSFIYLVSSSSTTGARKSIANEQIRYFERIERQKLRNPTLIGFGISNRETFEHACRFASGAIIGSAFIKALEQGKENIPATIKKFTNKILNQ